MCILATSAEATQFVQNLSTGIDDSTGKKLGNGLPDTNYVIGAGGTGGYVGAVPITQVTPLPPPYVPDSQSANSSWIAIYSGNGVEQDKRACRNLLSSTQPLI